MARRLVAAAALLWALAGVASGAESGTCPSCRPHHDQLRDLSLKAIKEQILNKLGMKHAPNMTGRTVPRVPPLDALWDVYSMQGDQPFQPGPSLLEERDDFTATPERVIAFAQPHPKLRHGRGQEILYFKFSDKIQESRVDEAQLWLYLRGGTREDSSPVTITLHKVLQIPNSEQPPHTSLVLTTKEARVVGKGRWISLEVRKLVSEWFRSPKDNLGLVVEASPSRDSRWPLIISTNHHDISQTPFLEVHTTEAKKHRTKRMVGLNCPENSEETRCCRYPLKVDFEEFGWDWIIAPKKYDANYCSGECPYVFFQNNPHTHLVRLANPESNKGACCAPSKLSAISMLYFDQDTNIIYSSLPGMVVDHCGCS